MQCGRPRTHDDIAAYGLLLLLLREDVSPYITFYYYVKFYCWKQYSFQRCLTINGKCPVFI